ncbi:MAG: alpha/beta hydrolase fold protein [Burkholderia sp.]|jgi:pimeloyl-ACP methyl ester carboxylesterase|nr:alpha/beta hydrolase fold protein [Burkholderia sp.]
MTTSSTLPTACALDLLESRFPQSIITLASDARVAVRTCGEGPAIVLLHGIGSSAASWLHCALELGKVGRVVAWDAPGYGESTPLDGTTPNASDYAERLHQLLQAIGITSCVLVGHSLGALMACAFAHGRGLACVQRVLLFSPARGYGAPLNAAMRDKVHSERLQALRTIGVQGMAEKSPARMLTPQADEAARTWVRWNTLRLNPEGYAQAVEMLCAEDLARYINLRMPVEVHCGDSDLVTPPENCLGVAEAFCAHFSMVACAGHAVYIEQPGAVASLIAHATNLTFFGVSNRE